MELQRSFSVSMNEYEENERTQVRCAIPTEDVYQCLQFQPTAAQGTNISTKLVSERCERKYVFLMFAMNILISTTILAIVVLNYSHNIEIQPVKEEKESWLLHNNVFYLFWREQSDCVTAESFCSKRNASLAKFSVHNKVWLMSSTNGKQFLVLKTPSEGSGDIDSSLMDKECGIMTPDVDMSHGEGFVCERVINPIRAFHDYPHFTGCR